MEWYELSITTTEEASDPIAAVLNEWGAGGVSIEESWLKHEGKETPLGGWYEVPNNGIPIGTAIIRAYFSKQEPFTMEQLKERAKQLLEQVQASGLKAAPGKIDVGVVREEDWADAWKKYYHPVRVTERLTVKPPWEHYEPEANEIVIELDPGMAFGTGTHATTVLCLKMLEKHLKQGDHVIDVGTGSGILAAASAKLGADKVLALDLDPVAVSSAEENARLNGLEQQIQVRQSDLLGIVAGRDNFDKTEDAHANHREETASYEKLNVNIPVDAVVANILADIILRFVDDAWRILKPGGIFIASGIIEKKRREVEEELKKTGFHILETAQEGDWVAIVAGKAQR